MSDDVYIPPEPPPVHRCLREWADELHDTAVELKAEILDRDRPELDHRLIHQLWIANMMRNVASVLEKQDAGHTIFERRTT